MFKLVRAIVALRAGRRVNEQRSQRDDEFNVERSWGYSRRCREKRAIPTRPAQSGWRPFGRRCRSRRSHRISHHLGAGNQRHRAAPRGRVLFCGHQAAKDLGFKVTMQNLDTSAAINRFITQPDSVDIADVEGWQSKLATKRGGARRRLVCDARSPAACRCCRR